MTDLSDPPISDPTAPPETAPEHVDARAVLAERLFGSLLGGMELLTVDVGLATGLYAALAAQPCTAAELAAHTGTDHRYVKEWVEQQAAADLIDVDDAAAAADDRVYRLSAAHAEVLLDPTSPYHQAPAGSLLVGLGRTTPDVRGAFSSGAGVAFSAYGAEIREGIAGFNRPMISGEMASSWLPAMGSVHQTLVSRDTVRVLDLGCGLGWSSIALARAYPHAVVRGVDLDAASIAAARDNAAAVGVADRVGFTLGDATTFQTPDPVDLVTCFETLHDIADPVAALRSARRALRDGGYLLVADEKTAEAFTAPAEPYERFLYAFSVLHCLPATRAEDGPVAHGSLARPADVLDWFDEAGVADVRILDVDNDMWRFYLGRA
ncbi:class I SAM-dependent methyltransferase [Euzebya tangerina]|uniref:class I SAM-dependent methyltransferase n=1 Tax=Euzebya tangerina TaxID=591198 RepID=UPI000E31FC1A|nr:class I SAM-dependent methyltransferase [Euzebya tangerina]